MKVLITVQTYYPRKDGVQNVTQYVAEGLVKKNNIVTVITKQHGGDKEEEFVNGVLVKRINLSTKYGLYFGEKKQYLKLVMKECKNNDVLINVCTQNAFTDLLLNKLKNINIKKILYLHGMYDFKIHRYDLKNMKGILNKIWKNIRWSLFYKVNNKNFKKYDKIINIHEMVNGTQFFINKYNIKPTIIENAADDDFFIDNLNKKKRFICVSNYSSDKNQEMIINSFYKANRVNEYELVFIGSRDNQYLRKLKKIKAKLDSKYGNRKVIFMVNIDRKETIKWIKESAVYLFGSKHEMFPLAIVEAIASNTPYISTNVGCVRNIPGGCIVESEREMSYMIDLLCTHVELRKQLAKIGYDYANEHFKIQNKVDEIDNLIRKL